MGYELHITRKGNWLDEDLSSDILIEEWKAYVESDKEMQLDNFAETISPDGAVIRMERDGISIWKKHSRFDKVWFSWFEGEIKVNKPDNETIGKMIEISKNLAAKVQGDEGEIYDEDGNGKIITGKN